MTTTTDRIQEALLERLSAENNRVTSENERLTATVAELVQALQWAEETIQSFEGSTHFTRGDRETQREVRKVLAKP